MGIYSKRKGIATLGRPRNAKDPQITRSVSFNAQVLEALQTQDISVSEAVNRACIKYYIIG